MLWRVYKKRTKIFYEDLRKNVMRRIYGPVKEGWTRNNEEIDNIVRKKYIVRL
jgi:hypothetical protein